MTAISRLRSVEVPPDNELLRGMQPQEIELILAEAKARRFSAKSVIKYQGESADQLFLLCKGRARYFYETRGAKRLILRWITPGQIFGATALALTASTYLASVEAVRDSTVFVWNGPTIRDLAQRFPRLMMNAYLTSKDYVSWFVDAHAALTSQTARARLAHVLLEYASSIGRKVSGGIELEVTNEELADGANITPYTASRLISEWHRTGAICKHRGKIIVRSAKGFFLHTLSKKLNFLE